MWQSLYWTKRSIYRNYFDIPNRSSKDEPYIYKHNTLRPVALLYLGETGCWIDSLINEYIDVKKSNTDSTFIRNCE
jgi:hypothetical protein